jgi:hypothetical protein
MKFESRADIIRSIMEFAVIININTDACVFVNFQGHISTLEVAMYLDGDWSGNPHVKETIDIEASMSTRKLMCLRDYLKDFWLEYANGLVKE